MRYGNIENPDIIDTTCELVHDKFIDDYTKLLLHMDNGVVDSAKNATVTNNNVTFSTTSKFGGYSGLFNGTTAYLTVPDSDNWWFGNGDFTIDFWARWTSFNGANVYMLVSQYQSEAAAWWVFQTGTNIYIDFFNGSAYEILATAAFTPTIDTWYHIAVVRSRDGIAFYIDGVNPGSTITAGSAFANVLNNTGPLYIGQRGNGTQFFPGYLDEVRISKGIARWTANFTPPTQSYDCPLDTQTKLLIHGGGPNNGTTFYDNSITARTLTTHGTVNFDSAESKYRVSAIKFDGSTGYLSAPDSADWAFGSGNFTIDFWMKMNLISVSNTPINQGIYPNAANMGFMVNFDSSGFYFYYSDGVTIYQHSPSYALTTGVWYHVAIVRAGNNLDWYVNGTKIGVTKDVTGITFVDSTEPLLVGCGTTAGPTPVFFFHGWLDEVRISKGIARWTSDFTPPTATYDSPITHYVIDGLDGDTDKEYRFIQYVVNGVAGTSNKSFWINNDTAGNYGFQYVYGANTTSGAFRSATGEMRTVTSVSQYDVGIAETILYAKSGKNRIAMVKSCDGCSGTTVSEIISWGHVWNNTVDNITNLVFSGGVNGFWAGSRFILLKKRQLTTGTKTGEIDPQGTTYGHWQLIYDNTLTAAKTNLMLTSQMDSYTKLLIHADGADASTAFYDFSNSAHAITAVGTAQVDTAQSKFGGASLLLDGNSDYLTIPDNDDFYLSGDFTIDCWVRMASLASDGDFIGCAEIGADPTGGYVFGFNSTRGLRFVAYTNGFAGLIDLAQESVVGWSINTWYHVAVTRSGNTWTLYKDGVSVASTSSAVSLNNYVTVTIGAVRYGATITGYMNGWIDEFRLSKGIARWTANFTPPTRAYNELDGDRDVVYKMVVRGVWGSATNDALYILPNNDTTASVYGDQRLQGANTTVTASRQVRSTGLVLGEGAAVSDLMIGELLLYSKSGFVRTGISIFSVKITGTTISELHLRGNSWNNVTDKVKSILVNSGSATSGLGIGTHVELWRLNLT